MENKHLPFIVSLSIAISISILFVAIIFWTFFYYSESAAAGKDALSTVGNYFGGITTLSAAIVAGYLFNDWRDNENFKRTQILYDSCIQVAYDSTTSMENILNLLQKRPLHMYQKQIDDLVLSIINSTFDLIAKVGMDYNESIKNDKKLDELTEIVIIINKRFRDYKDNTIGLSFTSLDAFSDEINVTLDRISRVCLKKYDHYFD